MTRVLFVVLLSSWAAVSLGAPPVVPRCEVVPLAGQRVSFRIDGVEKTRWHFAPGCPRPFFFPFYGPAGGVLTRMGHPGAPNHDHHRSIWLAHHDVEGVDFWSDRTEARIRQRQWYCYLDGDDRAAMASLLGWYDGDGRLLMDQDLIALLWRLDEGEHALEIQITMRPPAGKPSVQLGKTNFGFLAVRVAKSVSVHFGGGRLTSSEGQVSEAAIFGRPARWVDYSGPVAVGRGSARRAVVQGITYFDHPANPRYPTRWHVREDGWMGASFCMDAGFTISADKPLRLRYLLYAHRGPYDAARARSLHQVFAKRPSLKVIKSSKKHTQYELIAEHAGQ